MKRKNRSDRPARADSPIPASIFQRHRNLARLGLAVLVPLLFLGLGEGLLRLTGFGYPTKLYLPVEKVGAYGANRHFGWRFWPREIARYPVPQNFSLVKPERTCRIFTMGASAVSVASRLRPASKGIFIVSK